MAYTILKDEYYQSGVGVPPPSLGIIYDPTTGDYQLKSKTLGLYSLPGSTTFFANGSWTGEAARDPKLFKDGDVNQPTQQAKDLSIDINKKAYAAFQTLGGSPKNKINDAARPANQTTFKVNNYAVGTNPGISSTVPGIGTALSNPPGQGNIFDPGLNLNAYSDFKSENEEKLFKTRGLLKYPIDILDNQQDTLQITMYNYKAPLGDLFNPKPDKAINIPDIFTKGLQRNSALKTSIGTVILPIPGGIGDSNNVDWGSGQMNNMSAAVTGKVSKDMGSTLTVQAITQLLSSLTQAATKGTTGLPTQLINQIGLILSAGGNLNNPEVKTAITSAILKNAGFDVSPESILQRGAGIVPNSNLELLFGGPQLRQFSFAYRLSPRSALEATNVKRIIRFFKQGSAARKLNSSSGAGAASVFLGTPNVFKLVYKTAGNKSISGVNKFKICALPSMNVSYAPDGQWAAYDEGQPVSYTLTLNFQELEPVYESDYQTTIFKDLSNDNEIVNEDDIGY